MYNEQVSDNNSGKIEKNKHKTDKSATSREEGIRFSGITNDEFNRKVHEDVEEVKKILHNKDRLEIPRLQIHPPTLDTLPTTSTIDHSRKKPAQEYEKVHDSIINTKEEAIILDDLKMNKLRISSNGVLCKVSELSSDSAYHEFEWEKKKNQKNEKLLINGCKQRIYAIGILDQNGDSETDPIIVGIIKSKENPYKEENLKNKNLQNRDLGKTFAGATPQLAGGIIEKKDMKETISNGDRDVFETTLGREITEETKGMFEMINGTKELFMRKPNKEKNAYISIYTVKVKKVENVNIDTSAEQYRESDGVFHLKVKDLVDEYSLTLKNSDIGLIKKVIATYVGKLENGTTAPDLKDDNKWTKNGPNGKPQWEDYYVKSIAVYGLATYIKDYIFTKAGKSLIHIRDETPLGTPSHSPNPSPLVSPRLEPNRSIPSSPLLSPSYSPSTSQPPSPDPLKSWRRGHKELNPPESADSNKRNSSLIVSEITSQKQKRSRSSEDDPSS
jgi:hypothetical protein